MAVDQAICSTQQTDPVSDFSSGPEPMAPVDGGRPTDLGGRQHSPILVRLTGTLNQTTAVNIVPVVGELIADGGRDSSSRRPT